MSNKNSMTETSQVVVGEVKQTDHKTIAGSNPGDHRGQASQPDPLKGNDSAPRTADESEGA